MASMPFIRGTDKVTESSLSSRNQVKGRMILKKVPRFFFECWLLVLSDHNRKGKAEPPILGGSKLLYIPIFRPPKVFGFDFHMCLADMMVSNGNLQSQWHASTEDK
jgi:hypothetical protein